MDEDVNRVGDEKEDGVGVYGFEGSDDRAKNFEVTAYEIDTGFS